MPKFQIQVQPKGKKEWKDHSTVGPSVKVGGKPRELRTQREALRFGFGCNLPLKGRGAARYATKRGNTYRAKEIA